MNEEKKVTTLNTENHEHTQHTVDRIEKEETSQPTQSEKSPTDKDEKYVIKLDPKVKGIPGQPKASVSHFARSLKIEDRSPKHMRNAVDPKLRIEERKNSSSSRIRKNRSRKAFLFRKQRRSEIPSTKTFLEA